MREHTRAGAIEGESQHAWKRTLHGSQRARHAHRGCSRMRTEKSRRASIALLIEDEFGVVDVSIQARLIRDH